MMLLGEGGEPNIEDGLRWVERAGGQGEYSAWRLLADCYENGFCGVPVDADRAQVWRGRMEEYARLHSYGAEAPTSCRRYSTGGAAADAKASLDGSKLLLEIEGVTALLSEGGGDHLTVYYDPAVITAAELDESIRAAVAGLE